MLNDKIGQISLERDKNKKSQKNRITQQKFHKINSNSYSKKANERFSSGIFTLSGDDVNISYANKNPKNSIETNNGFSYGNVIQDSYTTFNDSFLPIYEKKNNLNDPAASFFKDPIGKNERKNATYDVLKNTIDKIVDNKPFPNECKSVMKGSMNTENYGRYCSTSLVSTGYENYDVKDSFKDDSVLNLSDNFYIIQKNYYNSGNIKTFKEKDNVKCNSILDTANSFDPYFEGHEVFATSGFVYKSNKPESIAFGGLKK